MILHVSTIVRSTSAAPAIAAAAASRWCIRLGLRQQSNASTRAVCSSQRWFASANGKVNGASSGDEGPSSRSSLAASMRWRRKQIDSLESKFTPAAGEGGDHTDTEVDDKNGSRDNTPDSITSDEELQPMWRDMESRVTRRRSLTAAERKAGEVGRRNIRKSDEDVWLEGGLYNEADGGEEKKE